MYETTIRLMTDKNFFLFNHLSFKLQMQIWYNCIHINWKICTKLIWSQDNPRCGQSAPLLCQEFKRQLRMRGLYHDSHDECSGGVAIYFISHVEGHKYAANVMIYIDDEILSDSARLRHRNKSWLTELKRKSLVRLVTAIILKKLLFKRYD